MSNSLKKDYKYIMAEFYETMYNVLPYEWSTSNEEFSKEVLNLLLLISGQVDSKEQCFELLCQASNLQTITDRNILSWNLGEISNSEKIVFDLKSTVLKKKDVHTLSTFDIDIILKSIENDITLGSKYACKLFACMNWLGLGVEKNQKNAISIWETLAYSGDDFSMQALNYAYSELQDKEKAQVWHEVHEILNINKDSLCPIIEENYYETSSEEAIKKAELILCIINSNRNNEKKGLNLSQLYYAINSQDTQDNKIINLCDPQTNYYLLLLREKRIGNKKFGF